MADSASTAQGSRRRAASLTVSVPSQPLVAVMPATIRGRRLAGRPGNRDRSEQGKGGKNYANHDGYWLTTQ